MKKRILSILLICCMVLTMLPTTAFAAVSDSLGNTPEENQAILEQLSALTGGSSDQVLSMLNALGLLDEDGNFKVDQTITLDGQVLTLAAVMELLENPATDLTRIADVDGTPVALGDLKTMIQIEQELQRIKDTYFSDKEFTGEALENLNSLMEQILQRLAHHAAHIHRLNARRRCGRGGILQTDALQLHLLHQAVEILQCFPGKLPAGEIGVLDPLQLLFDLDHGLQIAQRHRSPIHVGYTGEIRGGIFQQLHDSRQCQHLAVQRDGLIHLEIAVFIQQPQSVQHGKHLVAATAGQGGELLQNRLIFLGCVAQRIAHRMQTQLSAAWSAPCSI